MKRLFMFILSLVLAVSLCSCKIEGDFGFSEPEWETEVNQETQDGTETGESELNEVDYSKPITEDFIQSIVSAEYQKPKNVILIIGDGMGPNDIAIAEKYAEGKYDFGLILNKLTDNGYSTTKSADNDITDSAAAGTALSTGYKTNNGMIGLAPDGSILKTMGETAREAGKKVGIVTDDEIFGATPSAFMTHVNDRYNYGELSKGIIDFAPEVMIGKGYDSYIANLSDEKKAELENKYSIAKELAEFDAASKEALENEKFFAGFNGGYTETVSDHLAKSAQTALEILDNEKGFFLLIESAGTDIYGHSNNIQGKQSSVINLEKTLASVLLFMEKNPDTLLIVTSDHETGGVKMPEGENLPANDLFTLTTHTATDVRVFALGQGSEYFKDKTVDNTEIAKFVSSAIIGEEATE